MRCTNRARAGTRDAGTRTERGRDHWPTRTGRFGPVPAKWIDAEAAKRDDFDVDVVDLAQVWLPDVLPENLDGPLPQAVTDLAPWLASIAGGLRAVADLRGIFPKLHAVTVRDSVCFPNYQEHFDDEGRPEDPEGCGTAAEAMFDQLARWGHVLCDARARQPYPG